MLETPVFLGLVALAWLLYAGKTVRFVLFTLDEPGSGFFHELASLYPKKLFRLCLRIQGLLLLPTWSYSLAVSGVALYRHAYGTALLVQVFIVLIGLAGTYCFRYRLQHPGRKLSLIVSFFRGYAR